MDWIPPLRLGWLNGWLPALVYAVVLSGTIFRFPKDVRRRLFDTSAWTPSQKLTRVLGGALAITLIALMTLSPLKIGHPLFIVGGILYVLGLWVVVVGLFNFRDAPPDRPATNGLYRMSRNPQSLGLGLLGLGICLAIGSWLALLLFAAAARIYHQRVLAEEQACLQQYGDSYRRYMESVPRYFGLR